MKYKSLVREDAKGLYIKSDGSIARPGNKAGYDHVLRMDDGGLKKGDKVFARHRAYTPLTRITTQAGIELHWHHEE